jgi:hypothetical protein
MGVEKVQFEIKVFDNYIEITPIGGVKDNSIYEIKLKNLKEANGKKTLESATVKLCTAITPAYASIQSVNSLIESCNVPDDIILYHIREASRFVEYITGQSYTSVPFEVEQYVKYKAAYECVLRFHIDRASEGGQKGQLGDVVFDKSNQLPDITALLKTLKAETTSWMDSVRGYKIEGRAKPLSAVKGSYILTTRQSNDSPPKRSDWGG